MSQHSTLALLGLLFVSTSPLHAENQTTAGGFTGPASLLVECGELAIRIDGPKLWTNSRIDFRGERLGIEDSAYGTVFNIAGVGFIGSAHREVETEQIRGVKFFLDDRPIDGGKSKVSGRSFRCERTSQVRDLSLVSTLELAGNRLTETACVKAARDVKFEKVYHFMHAWRPEITHFQYGRGEELLSGGRFSDAKGDDRQFYYEPDPDWVAVFDAKSGHAAVSRLLAKPKVGGAAMKLWNVQGVYRKFYFETFVDQTMPADFQGEYRMTTEFFVTTPEQFRAYSLKNARGLIADPES